MLAIRCKLSTLYSKILLTNSRLRGRAGPLRANLRDASHAVLTPRASGRTERLEKRHGIGVLGDLELRMPLRAEAEAGEILEAHRFDDPIVGAAFGLDPRGGLRNALPMQRIHLRLGLAEDARELAAGAKRDLVSRPVHLLVRHVLRRAVIHAAVGAVDLRVESAAERDVQLLEAAADAEDRDLARDRGADQRQRDGIAPGILRRF